MSSINDITLSGQLSVDDIKTLAEQGIKSIVNNRPDFEEAGQPTSDDIAKACAEQGIAYAHIPFAGGQMTTEHLQSFADFFNGNELPLHLFCRTGNRSNGLVQAAIERDMLDLD